MHEALWVLGLLLLIFAWALLGFVPGDVLVITGRQVMLGAAAIGIPLELLYFGLLARALHVNGQVPKGWYWRSFAHHHLLTQAQRRVVLPPFYAGALAFLGIALGIVVVVLGFVSVLGLLSSAPTPGPRSQRQVLVAPTALIAEFSSAPAGYENANW